MFLVGRCVVTLTLLVAVCGGVHVKPTVYLIHEETDGMELPTDSAIKLAVRDVALNESTDLKWLPVPKVPVLTCSYTLACSVKIAAIMNVTSDRQGTCFFWYFFLHLNDTKVA